MSGSSSFIDSCASKLTADIVSDRQQTCGQLKVTITAPGAQDTVVARPQPSNTTNYLDSCSSTTAMSSSAGRRLRADISSVAAPSHAAPQGDAFSGTAAHQRNSRSLGQSCSNVEPEQATAGEQAKNAGITPDSADTGSNHDSYTEAPDTLAPADRDSGDPKLQLRTQIQQLSELSHLMSQRMTLSDGHNPDMGPEAARARADAVHCPETAKSSSSTVAVTEAGVTCPSHGVYTAQHAQHDRPEPLGNSICVGEALLSSAEPAQEAATTFQSSTGNANIRDLIVTLQLVAFEPVDGHH